MKQNRLPVVLHPPTDGSEGRYFAEVPGIPGCYGWGETPADALLDVESVFNTLAAQMFDQSDSLPELAALQFKPSNGAVARDEAVLAS